MEEFVGSSPGQSNFGSGNDPSVIKNQTKVVQKCKQKLFWALKCGDNGEWNFEYFSFEY